PKPVNHLTLSAADGEALMARVQRSNLPPADAEKVAWVIRMSFYVVCALQEATLSAKRLRALRCGQSPRPALAPAAAAAPRPAKGEGTRAAAVLAVEADGAAAPAPQAQPPERAKATGGPRPGPGRLGAEAYEGAERVECRHEELAVGQRCPVCGHGT